MQEPLCLPRAKEYGRKKKDKNKKDKNLEKIVLENYKIFIKDFAYHFNFLQEIRENLDETPNNYISLNETLKQVEKIRKNSI